MCQLEREMLSLVSRKVTSRLVDGLGVARLPARAALVMAVYENGNVDIREVHS